jgi:type IV secretory pathway VirB2 component (pilin)
MNMRQRLQMIVRYAWTAVCFGGLTTTTAQVDAVEPLTDFLCSVYGTVSGPFGIALSLVVLGVGFLLWALGARGALSRVGQAVVAIAALLSLPVLFTSLFPAAAGTACGL